MNEKLIAINVKCSTPEEAIRAAGKLLLEQDFCTVDYVDAMVACYQEYGEYIVIDEGIAMPHARPELGSKQSGFSIVTLDDPIPFNHPDNDPVSIVIGLSGFDADSHLKVMQRIAELFSQDNIVEEMRSAQTVEQLVQIVNMRSHL